MRNVSRSSAASKATAAMPNTPLLLGKGASALCPSDNISEEDKQIVYNMFAGSGVCEYIACLLYTSYLPRDEAEAQEAVQKMLENVGKHMSNFYSNNSEYSNGTMQRVRRGVGTGCHQLERFMRHSTRGDHPAL